MHDLNGIDAAIQLQQSCPRTAALMLSMFESEQYIVRAARAGARGYLLKDVVERDLLEAIQVVHSGGSFFSPAVARRMARCSRKVCAGIVKQASA